tara:strand:+ start:1981 stop:2718 length:738 start_codon:yes stop_codon:yes gene_type:complete
MIIKLILIINSILNFTPLSESLNNEKISLLVIYKTGGFIHKEGIEAGKKLFDLICNEKNYDCVISNESTYVNSKFLENIKVIVFLNTSGDILNNNEKIAMESFIRNGGGFIGIHSATDTEYEWEWYGKLVGAYFMNHPDIQKATIITEKKHHFLTDHLKDRWSIKDEWYNFKNFNPDINVLLSLKETSYEGGENGEYHPISWYHEFEGGRSFYTGLGHVGETYKDSRFVKMIEKAILYTSSLTTK